MLKSKNIYILIMYVVLLAYTAYTFLWSKFGLGLTLGIQYILLVFSLWGFFRYLKSPIYGKSKFINCLILLLVIQIFAWYTSGSSTTTQLKETLFILLVGAPFVSEVYNPKHMRFFMLAASILSIYMAFYSLAMIRLEDENGYGGGYMSLVALPLLLYYTKEKTIMVQSICSVIVLAAVLFGMKRGDIFACILALISYWGIILYHSGKYRMHIFIICIVAIFAGYYLWEYMLQHSAVFAWKMQQTIDGDSSGRDIIYSTLYNHFFYAPFDVQLFGGGFDASVKIAGNRAHSDWLEILTCEGVLGVLLYLCAFVSLFFQTIFRKDMYEKAILASVLAIWFVKSIFSMFIFSQSTILLFVLVSYILNKRIDKRYEY